MLSNRRFPIDWETKTLSNIGESYSGLKNKTKKDFNVNGNARYVTYRNINQNYFVDVSSLDYVDVYPNENQHNVLKGDVLFTGSSETPDEVGISSVMVNEEPEVYLNSFCFGYRFNNLHDCFPYFYGYYFRANQFRKDVFPLAQGSTRYNLSKRELMKIQIPVPPNKEQKKIAAILTSVDESIEKTEAIIEQTEKVKKGLMQQLLTKGIGHTKYKETEFGVIPGEWEVVTIGSVTDIKTGGTPSKKNEEYWSNGEIKWMASGDIHLGRVFDVSGRITEKGLGNSNARLLPPKTVMIALNGQGKTRGTVALLETEMTCNQSLAGFLPSNKFEAEYLFYNLQSRYGEIRNYTGDGARTGLNLGILKEIKVPLPTIEEQRRIANILETFDKKLKSEKEKQRRIILIKKGLMQSLLTGKVRVQVDDPEVVSS